MNDYSKTVDEMKEVLGDRYDYAVQHAHDLLIEKTKCIPGMQSGVVIDEYNQARMVTKFGLNRLGTIDLDIGDHRRTVSRNSKLTGMYIAVMIISISLLTVAGWLFFKSIS